MIDLYLLAGQSNMSGHGTPDDVPEALRGPYPSALLFFAPLNPPDHERCNRLHVRHWQSLQPGAGSPPGGFGPELSFGHRLAATTGRPLALIKSDKGGSGLLTDWEPDKLDDPTTLLNRCLVDAADAVEALRDDGHDPVFRGLVWYQGEADCRAGGQDPDAYAPALRRLVDRVGEALAGGVDYAKVLFRVNPHDDKPSPHTESIRRQLVNLADADPLAAWVDIDDLHFPDRLHLDGPSLLTAGDRAAEAMARLLGQGSGIRDQGSGENALASAASGPPDPRSPVPDPPSKPLPTAPPPAAVGRATSPPKPADDAEGQVTADPDDERTAAEVLEETFSDGLSGKGPGTGDQGSRKGPGIRDQGSGSGSPAATSPRQPDPRSPVPGPSPSVPDPLPRPAATRILALMNQKGGVGKTTTAVNVGAALANLGLNVLCIDLDPQAHLTLSLGIEPDQLDKSNYDLLVDPDTTAMEVVRYTPRDDKRLGVLPAETNLAGVESELADQIATGLAQTLLRNKCRDLVQQFDYVLIDCPPSLGLLTINALTMAREIVVPMQAHFLALQGMTKLFETIRMVRQGINPDLTVAGVVLCMHEGNTLLAGEVMDELRNLFDSARGTEEPFADAQVFAPPIRRNIKLAEAPSYGQSVMRYAPDSNGAKDYLHLARSIAS